MGILKFVLLIPHRCTLFPNVLLLQTSAENELAHLSLCKYVSVSGGKILKAQLLG